MSDTVSPDDARSDDASSIAAVSLNRVSTFLLVFGAIALFLSFYLISIQFVEEYLQLYFERAVAQAIHVEPTPEPPGRNIRRNLIESVDSSSWVRIWGTRVDVSVLANDDLTWLYVQGRAPALPYPNRDATSLLSFHETLLPASAVVRASIGHNSLLSNSILTVSAVLLFIGLFVFNRHISRLQDEQLDGARDSRDRAAAEARRIEEEIEKVRMELREVEPAEAEHRQEIMQLQTEQKELRAKLGALAAREQELRGQADRAGALEQDSLALEELLEDATRDLDGKNEKIQELEKRLKREGKGEGGKSKDRDSLVKRLRFLYPNVEVDSRAIDNLIDIRDETGRLRAEECIKRLSEEADNLPMRRKVTGLPNHLSIYEMGFAGKRRVYFARLAGGRFRVLTVGAKNTQLNDLDYLAKIPRGEIGP